MEAIISSDRTIQFMNHHHHHHQQQHQQQYPSATAAPMMNGNHNHIGGQQQLQQQQQQQQQPVSHSLLSFTSSTGTAPTAADVAATQQQQPRRAISLQTIHGNTSFVSRRSLYPPSPPITTSTSYQQLQQQQQQQQSNIGVVSPLIHAPPSAAIHTVSTSSSFSSHGTIHHHHHQQQQQQGSNQSVRLNYHPSYFNPVSPTPRIDELSTTLNYTWDTSASSSGSNRQQQPRLPPHADTSFPNTNFTNMLSSTGTPKHERNVSIASNDTNCNNNNMNETLSLQQQLEQGQQQQQQEQIYSSAMKKQRPNSYIAPRHIPDTYTSRVGSCCNVSTTTPTPHTAATTTNNGNTTVAPGFVGGINSNTTNDNRRVNLRRQLSSGKIESFLSTSSNQDSADTMNNNGSMMDVDHTLDVLQQRPRSMSF